MEPLDPSAVPPSPEQTYLFKAILTAALGLAGVVAAFLIMPCVIDVFMVLTCQPSEVDSFGTDGRWVLRKERRALGEGFRLYREDSLQPATGWVDKYEQQGDLVFFEQSGGVYSVLNLRTNDVQTYEKLELAPPEHQAALKKLSEKPRGVRVP